MLAFILNLHIIFLLDFCNSQYTFQNDEYEENYNTDLSNYYNDINYSEVGEYGSNEEVDEESHIAFEKPLIPTQNAIKNIQDGIEMRKKIGSMGIFIKGAFGKDWRKTHPTLLYALISLQTILKGCLTLYEKFGNTTSTTIIVEARSDSDWCWIDFRNFLPVVVSSTKCTRQENIYLLMRAMGVPEQHWHPKRDNFIVIHYENIEPKAVDWMKYKEPKEVFFDLQYNFESVMQARPNRFSRNGEPTWDRKLDHYWDHRDAIRWKFFDYFQWQDIQHVRLIHGCGKVKVGELRNN